MVGWCSMGTFNDPCQHCQSGWNHQEVGSSTTARWTNETYGRGKFPTVHSLKSAEYLVNAWQKNWSTHWRPQKEKAILCLRKRQSNAYAFWKRTNKLLKPQEAKFGSQDSNPEKPDRRRDLRDMLELRLAICKWMGPCLGDVSGTYSVEISQCGCHCHERITVES